MKFTAKRLLAGLLSLLMLAPLAACGSQKEEIEDTDAVVVTEPPVPETTVPSRENTPDNLPSDLNFGGKTVRTLYCGMWIDDVEGENSGDVMKSAVYYSNLAVAERLNIDYQFLAGNSKTTQYMADYKNAVLSDSHDFEIAAVVQHTAAKQVVDHVFADLKGAKYLDLAQPWWNRDYMDKTTITDAHIFFLVGDIAPTILRWTSCAYFNKNLYENNFGDAQQMYDAVDNNEWTYDLIREMTQTVYVDVDNNGLVDGDDVMGFTTFPVTPMDHFTLTAGVRFSERDENGMYQLVTNSEHTVLFLEKLYQLLYETTGAFLYPNGSSDVTDVAKFVEDEALFRFSFLSGSFGAVLRDMESDYGILPMPKVTPDQDRYYSSIHDCIPLYSVPVFASEEEIEVAGAVMEAQSAENYRYVFPAMYDIALKVKYNRDTTGNDNVSRMIDIIHDNATTDFVYVYNYALSELGTLARKLMANQNTNFASAYKSKETAAAAGLAKLIEAVSET